MCVGIDLICTQIGTYALNVGISPGLICTQVGCDAVDGHSLSGSIGCQCGDRAAQEWLSIGIVDVVGVDCCTPDIALNTQTTITLHGTCCGAGGRIGAVGNHNVGCDVADKGGNGIAQDSEITQHSQVTSLNVASVGQHVGSYVGIAISCSWIECCSIGKIIVVGKDAAG